MKIPIPPADQRTPGTKNSVPRMKNPPPPPLLKMQPWERYAAGEKLMPTYDPVKHRLPPSMVTLTEPKESSCKLDVFEVIMFAFVLVVGALIFLFGVTHIL